MKLTSCATGRLVRALSGHRRTPWVVRFHPCKPSLLASGSLDHEVRLWDADTGQCIARHTFGESAGAGRHAGSSPGRPCPVDQRRTFSQHCTVGQFAGLGAVPAALCPPTQPAPLGGPQTHPTPPHTPGKPIASLAFHLCADVLAIGCGHKLYMWEYAAQGKLPVIGGCWEWSLDRALG